MRTTAVFSLYDKLTLRKSFTRERARSRIPS